MAKSHNFNFDGGEHLTKIGATWFVSYSFYLQNKEHINWKKSKTHKNRINVFNRTKSYHKFWLQQIVDMDNDRLNTNKLDLYAEQVKQMAKTLLNSENSNAIWNTK
jgi:hypothetical protein